MIDMTFRFRRLLCVILAIGLSFFSLTANAEKTDIRKLQERLLSLGFEIGKADGIPGEKTTAAVLLAQTLLAGKGYDVPPTGVPDANTAGLIMQEENSRLLKTLSLLLKPGWPGRSRNRPIRTEGSPTRNTRC